MCLTTKDPTIYVAEQDIQVYKTVQFYDNRNWLQKLFQKTPSQCSSISTGFDYKRNQIPETVVVNPEENGCDEWEVEQGYHSDANLQRESNAIFVIPKGTRYVKGWFNADETRVNYVSEAIIYKGILGKN